MYRLTLPSTAAALMSQPCTVHLMALSTAFNTSTAANRDATTECRLSEVAWLGSAIGPGECLLSSRCDSFSLVHCSPRIDFWADPIG
jgi:hypothetical protein